MSEQSQYYYFSISEAKIRIARTYYLNLIYFCRNYTIFTRFYEFMLQKVLKFANYAVVVLVLKIMLSCSNYAKNYASTIRQCLNARDLEELWREKCTRAPWSFPSELARTNSFRSARTGKRRATLVFLHYKGKTQSNCIVQVSK